MTIKAFVRGLREKELKKVMLTRPRPTSLLEAFETIQQVTTGMKQVDAVEKDEFEKMEMDILRRSYVEEHGRPLKSGLAEVYQSSRKDLFDQQLAEMARNITPDHNSMVGHPKRKYGMNRNLQDRKKKRQ
ncbi:hypothetical protein K3495_g7770 [Podosphaera aphanis]|nr:hypothetical protein K3495_g7770 [Podosphaera aphanis]